MLLGALCEVYLMTTQRAVVWCTLQPTNSGSSLFTIFKYYCY